MGWRFSTTVCHWRRGCRRLVEPLSGVPYNRPSHISTDSHPRRCSTSLLDIIQPQVANGEEPFVKITARQEHLSHGLRVAGTGVGARTAEFHAEAR